MKNKFNDVFLRILVAVLMLPAIVVVAVYGILRGELDENIFKLFKINKKES